MARSIRARSLLVTAAVTAAISVSVLPASASFPDQGPRVLFARAKMPPARTLSPSRGIGALDLFTMKQNGDDQVRVVKTDALLEYGGHWSPNGARMTFAGSKGKGNFDIYTAMADGTKRKQLTTTATNYSPNWSKNGQQIVWTRLGGTGAGRRLSAATLRGIDANLMVMNADGTDKHSIFTGLAMAPAWSPTAGRIAFSTYDGDSLDISWIKPNGLGLQQLTDFGTGTRTASSATGHRTGTRSPCSSTAAWRGEASMATTSISVRPKARSRSSWPRTRIWSSPRCSPRTARG